MKHACLGGILLRTIVKKMLGWGGGQFPTATVENRQLSSNARDNHK
jgi:hypothetical protein